MNRAVAFYVEAFGAVEVTRVTAPDGAVVATLRVQGTPVMVADESPGDRTSIRLGMVVADPDAMADRAVRAGARVVYPVADQD